MTSNAKILKFGSITARENGGLFFQHFEIDGAGEFYSHQEAILTTVIARLQFELDALTSVRIGSTYSQKKIGTAQMHKLWMAPLSGKASDLAVEGFVMLEKEMRAWASARNMHVCYGGLWHVMIGKTWCTPGYETPEKALEACWESGEYEDLDKCKAAGVAISKIR